MTLPPYFPSAASAQQQLHNIKPRLSIEDEEGAHLLLSMSQLVVKELQLEALPEEDDVTVADVDSRSLLEDSLSEEEQTDSIFEEEYNITVSSSSSTSTSWKNPMRTVSMDEDMSSRPPPLVEFVNWHHDNNNICNYLPTPLPPSFLPRTSHHPAVITPIRTIARPVVSLSSNVMGPTSTIWSTTTPLGGTKGGANISTTPPASSPSFPLLLELPKGFPKLPPLLSMKRDKKMNRSYVSTMNYNHHNHTSCDEHQVGSDLPQPVTDSPPQQQCSKPRSPSPVTTLVSKKKHSNNNDNNMSVPVVERSKKSGKKFSWKNYPELEDFLITNRPEYLRHSAQNYTLEQKDYNNTLTARLMEYAEQCGYGNLLHYPQDFGSFTAVRDRIRGYYKSYLQSSRRREQRRQKRLEKQEQKQCQQQHHHRAVVRSSSG